MVSFTPRQRIIGEARTPQYLRDRRLARLRSLSRNISEAKHARPHRELNLGIILPVVLYGCGTWSLTLREEHRLRVFENRVLRKIFGPKKDEVIGGWRKLHNEELHKLYCSPSIIRIMKSKRMRWSGCVARMGEKRNVYRILVGKLEGKRPLGRPGCRWEDNIRMDLSWIDRMGWYGLD
jgi:hypothetical protein